MRGSLANEIATVSKTTLRLNLKALPLFSGVLDLAKKNFITRAHATNLDFVRPLTREEGNLDPHLKKFLYDPQTSGGLLLAVPRKNAHRAEEVLRDCGALVTTQIGEVLEKEAGINLVIS